MPVQEFLADAKAHFSRAQKSLAIHATGNQLWRPAMSDVVYVSKIKLERKNGPLRVAHLPGESQPVMFSVHDEIARHYKVDPAKIVASHAATIDYVIAATAG
jgi:hypothetical protein